MLTIHPIYLEKVRPSLYIGRIEPGHLQEWEFYLAVRSQMPESKLILYPDMSESVRTMCLIQTLRVHFPVFC